MIEPPGLSVTRSLPSWGWDSGPVVVAVRNAPGAGSGASRPRPSNKGLLMPRVLGVKNRHRCQSFRCPILLSVPFQSRTILSLCLNQISVLTSREKIKNSCLCSFTIATTGKHPKAASAPPDE